jgi:thiol-disulfide isomerase/thioredoxin
MKKLVFTLVLLAATVVAGNAQVQGYSVGQTVSDFTVTDVHGNTHTLSDITNSGKLVVIDFFFANCGPCQGTVPFFSELHEKYGCNEGDIFCISISSQDDDAAVLQFENTYATQGGFAPAPAVSTTQGGGAAVVSAFNPSAYPTYCIVGADMKLKNGDVWPVSSVADLEAGITGAGVTPTVMSCGALSTENITMALNEVGLFPNPATNATSLSVTLENTKDVKVVVTDMLGAKVAAMSFEGVEGANDFEIATDELSAGQYLVSVSLGDLPARQLNFSVVK